jgi:ADP-heptose:LPS heptosyltransferase
VTRRPTVLVLRALGLGDLLTGVPALRALRRACPGHRVVLATPAVLAPLALASAAVDRVVDHHGLAPLPAGFGGVDLAVDLHGRGPGSQPLLLALRPGRLVSFAVPELGVTGPRWRRDEHEVARWCRLVGAELGGDPDPSELDLPPLPAPVDLPAGAVIVHPGAAFPARRWPAERFAAVVAALRAQGHPVLVTGGPGEAQLVARVAEAGGRPVTGLALGEFAGLVAGAALVLSGDTGTAHLATAYRRPSVTLFGPTPPSWWGPPDRPVHRVLWHGRGAADPHAARPDPALLRITVEEVLTATGELLAAGGAVPAVPVTGGGGWASRG